MANDAAISKYGLVVEEKSLGVGELELHKAARQACVGLAQHGLAANEVAETAARLVDFHGKAEPRLEHVILIGNVVPEMTIGLFEAQRVHCQQPRRPKPLWAARLQQNGCYVAGELARHVQLVTELADIADALGPHVRHTDPARAPGRQREARIREM